MDDGLSLPRGWRWSAAPPTRAQAENADGRMVVGSLRHGRDAETAAEARERVVEGAWQQALAAEAEDHEAPGALGRWSRLVRGSAP